MKLGILLLLTSSVLASIPCGIPLPLQRSRYGRAIIGGNHVTTSKWPWQVRLELEFEDEELICGGTVISDKWILTAAHCVVDTTSVIVVTGNSPSKVEEDRHTPLEIIPHKQYDSWADLNDIALLKLDRPLILDDSVAPICLPNADQPIPSDGYAVATGFGTANERGTNKTFENEQLRETILPIIPPIVCEQRWNATIPRQSRIGKMFNRSTICAGSAGHSAAWGDSGGPLMIKAADGRWFQIGIAVFMIPSHLMEADLGPNAFTDVRTYCNWIKEKTGGEVECQDEKVILEDVKIQR